MKPNFFVQKEGKYNRVYLLLYYDIILPTNFARAREDCMYDLDQNVLLCSVPARVIRDRPTKKPSEISPTIYNSIVLLLYHSSILKYYETNYFCILFQSVFLFYISQCSKFYFRKT